VGGRFFADSSQIDLLWAPRQPVRGGQEGNQQGNPHLDVGEVLALWRASVDPDLRDQWVNVDPAPQERGVIARAAPPREPSLTSVSGAETSVAASEP